MTACPLCQHEAEVQPQLVVMGSSPVWSYTKEGRKKKWSSYYPPPSYKAVTVCPACGITIEVPIPEGMPLPDPAQEDPEVYEEPFTYEAFLDPPAYTPTGPVGPSEDPPYQFSGDEEHEPHPEEGRWGAEEPDPWEAEGKLQPFPVWTWHVVRRYYTSIRRAKKEVENA